MDGACSTHGIDEKNMKYFGRKIERDHFKS
jgi:hypothetical protein